MAKKEALKMEKCYFCKGVMEKRKIQHLHKWGKKYIMFENLEAEVCRQCGEVYLSPEILELIDKKTKEEAKPKKTILVPVVAL